MNTAPTTKKTPGTSAKTGTEGPQSPNQQKENTAMISQPADWLGPAADEMNPRQIEAFVYSANRYLDEVGPGRDSDDRAANQADDDKVLSIIHVVITGTQMDLYDISRWATVDQVLHAADALDNDPVEMIRAISQPKAAEVLVIPYEELGAGTVGQLYAWAENYGFRPSEVMELLQDHPDVLDLIPDTDN